MRMSDEHPDPAPGGLSHGSPIGENQRFWRVKHPAYPLLRGRKSWNVPLEVPEFFGIETPACSPCGLVHKNTFADLGYLLMAPP